MEGNKNLWEKKLAMGQKKKITLNQRKYIAIKMTIKQKIGVLFICRFVVIGILFFTLRDGIGNDMVSLEKTGIFTAYTAIVSQTDSTPTITASNQKIREGVVANNCLPFGTKIKVNNRIYEIQDRMNERYRCDNFDIYLLKHSEALDFGRQTLKYEII
jgi:3D (Asp-Asp-Asp) domain-containing protein